MRKNDSKNESQFSLAMRRFGRNKLVASCILILGVLYGGALFAQFLAPYSFSHEERRFSYAPPTKIHFFDEDGLRGPFVYGIKFVYNEYHQRIYEEDKSAKFPLKLFVEGEPYKFLGLIPMKRHLWGVTEGGAIYLFGADARGRDVFSRLMYGGQISLSIGLIGVAISFSIGLLVGGIAGYYGGRIDDLLMRMAEMVMMVPGFYLLLALRAAVPPDFNSIQVYFAIVVIMSFIGWAGLARIIRGMCLSLRERDYVLAAKACGLSDLKIIVNHILPQTVSYSLAAIMLSIPGYILAESALSLIGLGIQDPYASWGNMLTEAMSIVRIKFCPWILLPGFFIFLTVVCFNVIGDYLRDALDPLLKGERNRV